MIVHENDCAFLCSKVEFNMSSNLRIAALLFYEKSLIMGEPFNYNCTTEVRIKKKMIYVPKEKLPAVANNILYNI